MERRSGASVVVVGGGVAGARTCVELRKQGYPGSIMLLCHEDLHPYDRPPLSKAVLFGKRETKPLRVDYDALDVDLRLGWTAQSLDLANNRLSSAHETVSFDTLVIATGASPLILPGPGPQVVLRTDADARHLRERLTPGAHVVIVGASWIGAETATVALARGCRVTCVEGANAPLAQALGHEMGGRFTSWWEGVELLLGRGVASVEHAGVLLTDGEHIQADVVLSGIGVRAATTWLEGSGLDLLPAVVTDEFLRSSQPGVLALGDAAAWWSRRFDTRMSVAHWDDASTAASVVASSIVMGESSDLVHDPVPYFWSDQFGHRIEYVGHHTNRDLAVCQDGLERGWTAGWIDAQGQLTAVLGVDQSREITAARSLIAAAMKVDSAQLVDSTFEQLATVTSEG